MSGSERSTAQDTSYYLYRESAVQRCRAAAEPCRKCARCISARNAYVNIYGDMADAFHEALLRARPHYTTLKRIQWSPKPKPAYSPPPVMPSVARYIESRTPPALPPPLRRLSPIEMAAEVARRWPEHQICAACGQWVQYPDAAVPHGGDLIAHRFCHLGRDDETF